MCRNVGGARSDSHHHHRHDDDQQQLYSEGDLEASFARIGTIDYRQTIEAIPGVRVTALNAGHVLGAAMFLVEIGGVRVLYTGDYSREEDRHLQAAEVPPPRPGSGSGMHAPTNGGSSLADVLIVESTYGVQMHQPRLVREARFIETVTEVVERGGRCLIPVFALGRAQELLLILDEHWQANSARLAHIPIFYASALAKKCMAVYQTYVNQMNDAVRRQIAGGRNPFAFRHIRSLKNNREMTTLLLPAPSSGSAPAAEAVGPCVVLASPAMLQSGLSRQLFEAWCGNKRNGLLIPGYVVEGTLGKAVLAEPATVPSAASGAQLPLRMSVAYISFSAHVDFGQNAEFIGLVQATHTILVHGEASEGARLRSALQHRASSSASALSPPAHHFYQPRNCETVRMTFSGRRFAKVLGKLADRVQEAGGSTADGVAEGASAAPPAAQSDALFVVGEGVLVQGADFEYRMVDPGELADFITLGGGRGGAGTASAAPDENSAENAIYSLRIRERVSCRSHAPPSLIQSCLFNAIGSEGITVERENAEWFIWGRKYRLYVDPSPAGPASGSVGAGGDFRYFLEWDGSAVRDFLADTVFAIVMGADRSRQAVKTTLSQCCSHPHTTAPSKRSPHHQHRQATDYVDVVKEALEERFGVERVQECDDAYLVTLGDSQVQVSLEDLSVSPVSSVMEVDFCDAGMSANSGSLVELVRGVVRGVSFEIAPRFDPDDEAASRPICAP